MIEALQRFVSSLRKAGLRISPAEAIDAARALQAAGVESRDTFRWALRATLAKTREEGRTFDREFDRFFAPPRAPRDPGRRGKGVEPAAVGAGGRSRPPAPDDEEREPGGRGGRPPRDREPRRSRPGRLRVILHGREKAAHAPPRETGRRPDRAGARPVPRQFDPRPRRGREPAPSTAATDPRRLDLRQRLTSDQERALAREIPRLIREIRLRAGRRRRPGRTGRLWTARLVRSSVATGGVPFVIPYRERRPRRPRLVVLVDVSWSVLRASSLFLQLAAAFVMRPRSRCRASIHLFVDRCVEATEPLSRWKGPDDVPLSWLLESVAGLDPKAPSDYGAAFYQAARSREGRRVAGGSGLPRGGRDAVLVVLGDARSNLRDPQAWAFDDLAAGCRRVIWLNPEPASMWDTGDSVLREYLGSCDLVCEARDLDGLARGVAEIVRSL